ncbi:MAG: hypothetical protein ACFFF9_02000 [Candidatus Thorarchaeota archaeon]
MEEPPVKGDWLHQNRRPVALIIIIFVVLPAVIIVHNFSNNTDTEYELSHSLTVWISPLEEEFSMYLDFYRSQQNAEEQVDKLLGIVLKVQPSDDEEHHLYLINIQEDLLSFWVRICFDSHDSEPFTILNALIGQNATTSLLGREFSILVQRYYA